MSTSTKALVLAIVSVLACPVLLFIEVVALMGSAMIIYEQSNPPLVKVIAVVVVFLIGAVAVALPVVALIMGGRARKVVMTPDAPMAGSSKALVAQVIAGLVLAGAVLVQIFVILWSAGVCSLDGC